MANQIKVKWPGQNIYEDETHRLVTDEQIARWNKISDAPIIGTITPNNDFNDIYQSGFYHVESSQINSDSVSNNAPTKNKYLIGGIVIAKKNACAKQPLSVPFAVIQIFYDIYLKKYMRVGVPQVGETNLGGDGGVYYGSDTIDWGDWAVVEYSLDEEFYQPEGITNDYRSTYYFELTPS